MLQFQKNIFISVEIMKLDFNEGLIKSCRETIEEALTGFHRILSQHVHLTNFSQLLEIIHVFLCFIFTNLRLISKAWL